MEELEGTRKQLALVQSDEETVRYQLVRREMEIAERDLAMAGERQASHQQISALHNQMDIMR